MKLVKISRQIDAGTVEDEILVENFDVEQAYRIINGLEVNEMGNTLTHIMIGNNYLTRALEVKNIEVIDVEE